VRTPSPSSWITSTTIGMSWLDRLPPLLQLIIDHYHAQLTYAPYSLVRITPRTRSSWPQGNHGTLLASLRSHSWRPQGTNFVCMVPPHKILWLRTFMAKYDYVHFVDMCVPWGMGWDACMVVMVMTWWCTFWLYLDLKNFWWHVYIWWGDIY
jgi:hypothetical protein